MGFTIPSAFDVIGSDEDVAGRTQINEGKGIGGGATEDGFDEWSMIVKNQRFCWASGNLAVMLNMMPNTLRQSSNSEIGRVAAASYPAGQSVLEVPVDGAEKRPDFIIECDLYEARVKVEFFDSASTSLGVSTSPVVTHRLVFSYTLTGVTTPENIHYVVVTVIPNSSQTGILYGIRILETEGTL